jgi:hypothetical protein
VVRGGTADLMKVLFLHGWQSVPGGVKPTYLVQHGHEVVNPKPPDENFAFEIVPVVSSKDAAAAYDAEGTSKKLQSSPKLEKSHDA